MPSFVLKIIRSVPSSSLPQEAEFRLNYLQPAPVGRDSCLISLKIMKRSLLSTVAASSALLLASCDRMPVATGAATPSAVTPLVEPVPAPVPVAAHALPAVDENTALEQEIANLKAEETELRLQMQRDELAVQKVELERQRDELTKDKAALELAAANRTAGVPAAKILPVVPREVRGDTSVPISAAGRDYQMFYEGLAPLGEWMETSEYGYVWQPTAHRTQGWRPYTKGRWADSDQGWTWISDEPFGWATYHYGRWALLRNQGWIWVPGDTWAPAWVSWRNNAEYVGWSPLPPETVYAENIDYGPSVDDDYGISPDSYSFMPVRYFDEPVYDYCRPVSESAGYFGLTVSVTRIVVRSGNVNCGGPEPRWVNSCLDRPMTRYRIDRDYDRDDRHDYRPHFEQDRLSCYSPRVRNSWNEGLRPSRLGGRWDDIAVVRREDSYRGDLARRYREEQQERRERATVSLRNDTVRGYAERHGKLERIRSQRDQLFARQEGNDRNEGRKRDQKPDSNKPGRGEDARPLAERNPRTEAARKELIERQEEVARLRQQRESAGKVKSEAEQAERGKRGNPADKDRGEPARPELAKQKDARERDAEQAQRGNRGSTADKEREDSARREQAKQNEARQRQAEQAQRGQRENQANKEREDSARREQAKQNEARQRQAEQAQRGQRESQAARERQESTRREQSQQNESRQRQAGQERGNRDREDNARREQAKQTEQRQPQKSVDRSKNKEDEDSKNKRGP